ncbi:hypothetical protein GCK32_008460 [Trichostrongylus colubriformis]|uniref:Uncharacterized protein n=1 Tax=Trichostrongylus colubriformis TaxID=6319 RepID=A0AAN8EZ54_TRICO
MIHVLQILLISMALGTVFTAVVIDIVGESMCPDTTRCSCQHGPEECSKNALQACVLQLYPNNALETVACIQGNSAFQEAYLDCIPRRFNSKDSDRLFTCATTSMGYTLVAEHGSLVAREISDDVYWVPWISIKGQRVPEAETNLEGVLCKKYLRVPECSNFYYFCVFKMRKVRLLTFDHNLMALFLTSLMLTATMPDIVSSVVTLDIVGAANCSDTFTFLKMQLVPIYKKYSSLLKINYHPFGTSNTTSCQQNGDKWECKCAKGPRECAKNILQACVLDKIKDPYPIDILKCIQFARTARLASYICLEEQNQVEPEPRNRDDESFSIYSTLLQVPWISIKGQRVPEADMNLEGVLCKKYLRIVRDASICSLLITKSVSINSSFCVLKMREALFPMMLMLTATMPDVVSSVVTLDIVGAGICGKTQIFIKRQLLPVYKKYSSLLKINYHPYGTSNTTSCQQNGDKWECECDKGPSECAKNILQACLLDKLTEPYPIDILKCIQFARSARIASYTCLEEQNQVQPEPRKRIRECAWGQEGVQLMKKHGEIIKKEISTNVTYVPWISIGGKREEQAEKFLEIVLCTRYFNPKPAECNVKG